MPKSKARIGVILDVPSITDIPTADSLNKLFANFSEIDDEFISRLQRIIAYYLLIGKGQKASTKADLVKDLTKLQQQIARVKKHISTEPLPTSVRNYSASEPRKLKEELDSMIVGHFTWSKPKDRFPHTYWNMLLDSAFDGMYRMSDYILFLTNDKDLNGWDAVESFDIWISVLTELMKSYNLPYSVNKATGAPPSKFVELVWNLQKLLPDTAQRHQHSKEALGQAIVRARSGSK